MSDLLNQASLVMVPSGYKEDTVYSVVPSDGSGDLAFTRASNGTRINSAGLVEVVAWNLLSYSEEFNNTSGWLVQNGASITANSTTAPNGTTTADTISYGTSSISACYQSVTNGAGVFTISVYARCASGTQSFKFIMYNGIDGQVDGPVYTVTTEWQRFQHSFTVTTGSNWYIANANDSVTRSIFIWGAQLNIGSTAKPYFPTTDRLNVPRLTYQNGGGGCPSLLLEKQSTNLALYSQQFDDGAWSKSGVTVTANDTTSPDGTQNAEKIEASGSGSISHSVRSFITTTSGSVYAFSLYAKKGTTDWIMLRHDNGGSFNFFNLNTGTKGTTSQASSTIESVGNGWYRLTVFHTGTGSNGPEIYIATADGTNEFTANGQTLYIWGAQYEASSYPTSLINTTSSSATRVADFDTSAGSSGNFGTLTPTGTKAVLYWELQFHTGSVGENINIGGFRNGLTNQYGMYYWGTDANKNFGFNSWNGDSYGITGADSLFDGQVHKIAGVFDFSNFTNNVLFIDGVKKTISQTRGTTNQRSANVVSLNSPDYSTQGNKCLLKEFVYFNQNLSDSELAALTTL